jgi:glycosyltransferase involved in cell wall biosynthesis
LGIQASAVTRYGYPINLGKFFSGRTTCVSSQLSSSNVTYHHLIPNSLATNHELDVAAKHAQKLVQRLRPSVLHAATDFINAEIAIAVAKASELPIAYEVRGFLEQSWLTKSESNTADSDFYKEFLKRETAVLQQVDAITTLSETMKSEIVDRGVPSEKIFLTPNAVSEKFLQLNKSASQARAELGLPERATFGIITTLYPFENTKFLIEVLVELKKSGREAQLLIVGDGPDLDSLQQKASQSEVRENIYILGRIPNDKIVTYYQAMDVFCVPRTRSRVTELVTPLKPLEAMALNRPVLASNLPALAELVTHEKTGLLVEPDSRSALTQALDRVLYDSHYRAELASSAKQWVAANRTWSQVAKTYQEVYRKLGKQ